MKTKFLAHTESVDTLLPFYSPKRPTPLYWLPRKRYGKYFNPTSQPSGKPLEESWSKVKYHMQHEYGRSLEQQGAILADIYRKRVATENTRAVDYLLWLDFQWSLYQYALKDMEYTDTGFVAFVQSDLSNKTELTEPECYGRRSQIS